MPAEAILTHSQGIHGVHRTFPGLLSAAARSPLRSFTQETVPDHPRKHGSFGYFWKFEESILIPRLISILTAVITMAGLM